MSGQKARAKVLPFRQGAAFYMKRGAKQMEKNNLLSALCRYRQAYESDPSNVESCLAVAEILYQMQRFEESNRVLLLYISMYAAEPECFFGIACNYFGMHEFDYAAESLETYLRLDPDGPFAYDAEDFLDVLDDDEELAEATGISDEEDFDTLTICTRARHLLDAGTPEIAAELLRQHLKKAPLAWRAWNLLAVAQYCAGDRQGALKTAEHVLHEDEGNVAAICNQILLLHTAGNDAEAGRLLDTIDIAAVEAPEALGSVALLQLELARPEMAQKTLQRLYPMTPYDTAVIHQIGYCSAQLGNFEGAERCYRRLLRIDPSDTVAQYYLRAAKSAAEGQGSAAHWPLAYRIPLPEMLRRLNHINGLFALPPEELRAKWETDREFQHLLNWVLTLPDGKSKRAVLRFYYAMQDSAGERALRSFLLRTDQGDTLKREVLGLLKHMKAREPYMAYLESQWIQGRVNMLPLQHLPAAYEQVLRLLLDHMGETEADQAVASAVAILKRYLSQCEGHYPRLSMNQESSFAAALDYLGNKAAGLAVTEQEICKRYRVTAIRLRNAIAKFEPYAAEET